MRPRHLLVEQPFVGREGETNLLHAALEKARAGHGQLVLLVGEPGIGKTRLLRELKAAEHTDDVRVRAARCWEGEGTPAYWPWAQIVRAEVRDRGSAALAAELGSAAEDVARLVPELAPEHRRTNLFEEAGSFAVQVEHVRFRLFDGIVRVLEAGAMAKTLVILIDDLHWADVGSIRLLRFAAGQITAMRVLLVATMRELEPSGDESLATAMQELCAQSGIARVQLSGLPPDAIADYVEQTTGEHPVEALVQRLHARTAGNPFFLREIVYALSTEPRARVGELLHESIPETIRQAVGRRLHSLAGGHRLILSVAAVLGARFEVEVLRRCLEAATNEPALGTAAPANAAIADIDMMVDVAIERGLLAEVGPRRYEFTHALIREVLYDELGAAGRSTWHCVVGDVLEQWYGAQAEEHAAEIAVHLAECTRNPAALQRALQYNRIAGDRALAQFAYEAAMTDYERALSLLRKVGAADDRLHCELLLSLGEARMRAGAVEPARAASLEAATIARQIDHSPDLLARAALGFGWLFEYGTVDWERIGLLEDCLDRMPGVDATWRAKVMARLALALCGSRGGEARVRDLAEQAVAMARRLGDASTLAFALNVELYAVFWTPRATGQRLETSRELLALAERVGDRELALQSRAWCAATLVELGDRIGAEREMALFAVDAEALRQPLYRWVRAYWSAMSALLDGQFELGERLAEEAAHIGFQTEPANAQSIYTSFVYMLRWYQGRLGEFAPMLGDLDQIEERFHPGFKCGVAFILSEAGDEKRAREQFDTLAAGGFYDMPFDAGLLSALCAVAEACHSLGDVTRAAQLYEMLCPFAHLNVVMGWAVCCTGSVPRLLGLLATTMRRFEDAERHFDAAQAMHQRMRDRPMITRTQYDYAVMLHARDAPGDRERALALLDAAITTARAMGMHSVLAKAKALRESVGSGQSAVSSAASEGVRRESEQAPGTRDPGPGTNIFRRDGDMWSISFAGQSCQLRDARGMRYLSLLLRHPGHEMHAVDLIRIGDASTDNCQAAPLAVDQAAMARGSAGDAGVVLDAEATVQYQQRLIALREALAEAEALNDLGRMNPLREELAFLTSELTAAGRGKRAASHAERARVAVTKGIRAALRRIDGALPFLGRHLRATVRTGYFCSYTPDPRLRIEWVGIWWWMICTAVDWVDQFPIG